MIETSPSPVDVVPPCLDEAEALPWVLERIPPSRRGIVVDNRSTDGSADIVRALGAYVVHEPRRGFGAACRAGLSASTAEVVRFRDRDASLRPGPLPRLARPVLGCSDDLVLGRHLPADIDRDGHDAGFGPAADGGFWAQGLAAPSRAGSLVRGVPMSTGRTGAIQRHRLLDAGLSVRDLPLLRDVDTATDAASVAGLCPPGSHFAAAPASLAEVAR